jgi:hypothetical protein
VTTQTFLWQTLHIYAIAWLDSCGKEKYPAMYLILIEVNPTRVSFVVLLCLAFVSFVFGVSAVVYMSLDIQTSAAVYKADNSTSTLNQATALIGHYFTPQGDPINDPKPNHH